VRPRNELSRDEAQDPATLLQPVYGQTDDELPIGPP
jgi:hypothetical protein